MQLKKLTIHNIASIEDAEIDFSGDELGKAPIFLICGETGAGKTTILDSICLSLYGETPRMTSVSKEDLEFNDQADTSGRVERYYSNDNSQLLHRGAGEGFTKLLFTGNDDRDYEAIWEVHRAHNKAHKRLLRPTRLLRSIDGNYTENRINEIKGKVIELTGLEYDQFCRTVMLAQGEFTKFLKSNKSEKSEILEKLTGTEIYSRLGIKIAEHYNSARADWQQIKEDTERVRILSEDEQKEMMRRREEITDLLEKLTADREKTTVKLNWLLAFSKNEENRKRLSENINILEESLNSESFTNDRRLVEDYENSGEGRVILNNIKKNENDIKSSQDRVPSLRNEEEQAAALVREAKEKCDALEEKVASLDEQLEKIDLETLSKRYHELVGRDKALSDLIAQAERLKGEEKALKVLEGQRDDLLKRRDENFNKAEALKSPLTDAEQTLDEWREKLANAEVSVSDMVKDLRSRLKQGEPCPVCGVTVEREITDAYFESLLSPLRDSKNKAEIMYLTLKSNVEAALKLVTADEKSIKRLESKIKTAGSSLDLVRDRLLELKRNSIMSDLSGDELIEACDKARQELSKDIEEVRIKQNEGEDIQKELKKVRRKLKEATSVADKAKSSLEKIQLKLNEAMAEIKALENTRDGLWEGIRVFFINHPEVTMSRLTALIGYDVSEIKILKERIEEAEDRLKGEKGKLEGLLAEISEQEKGRPNLEDTDTKESLEKRVHSIDADVKRLSEENGAIGEALERDRKLREELASKQAELEKSRKALEKWEGLYIRLGDLRGVKFRAIAQSFILRSLLDNANVYMRSFNDRYTLTCNPGTLAILVKDGYKPSEPQPASILSGGESFMASLSLALSLSNLRSGGMAVDILFIDEGFGTLSAEYLGNVMDTLEKLHQIGGRKVGLISHVSEMKERIPVQIRVQRESPALSRVEVVELY